MTTQSDEEVAAGAENEQGVGLRTDVLLVFFTSWLLLLLIVLEPQFWILAPLRLVVGLAFVLFLPGYWLTAALFPDKADLVSVERTGLSLALSIVWVPILALILDRLPFGLRLWPILLGEYISILLFMVVALFRQWHLPSGRAATPTFSWRPQFRLRSFAFSENEILLGAVIVSMISVLWVAFIPSPQETMTEFYILGESDRAEDFPREVEAGEDVRVKVGMTNLEQADQSYRVEVWVEDPWQQGRRQRVTGAGPLKVSTDENAEWVLTWQMPWPGQDQKVELLLFRQDHETPYRRLRLFLNVKP